MDATATPAGWNTKEFTGTWPTATADTLPTPASISAYYCTSFDVTTVTPYASVDYTIATRGGYAIYFNGVEMKRANLPEGELSYTTQAVQETETAFTFHASVSFAAAGIAAKNNLVCVETHTETNDSENTFAFTLSLLANENDLVVDGTLTYAFPGFDSIYWHETVANAVDKSTSTKYNSMDSDNTNRQQSDHVWIAWTYNNQRSVFVNYLQFYPGNMGNRRPYNIDVYGSDDGTNWELLTHQTPSWTSASTPKEYTFSNTKSYRAYKLDTYGFESEGIEMAEVYFGTRATVTVCSGDSEWSAAYSGTKSEAACLEPDFIGMRYRMCINGVLSSNIEDECMPSIPENVNYGVNNVVTLAVGKNEQVVPTLRGAATSWQIIPILPNNLLFDVTTGTISGRIQDVVTGMTFTVTCSNNHGQATAVFTLNSQIVNCEQTEQLPATAHGKYAISQCPRYYIGYVRNHCLGGVFEEPDYTFCAVREASFFTYGVTAMSYLTGEPIEPLTLLYDSIFTEITINPTLPEGLTMSETGVLSGTPTEVKATTAYTVSGVSAGGNKEVTISITVRDNSCSALDGYPAANNGATSVIPDSCDADMHGSTSRLCTNGVFGPINYSDCVYKDIEDFEYTPSQITVVSGAAVKSAVPEYNGYVSVFQLVGTLPAGLSLTSAGTIEGKMTAVGTFTITVKAVNANSSAQTTLVLTVTPASCTGVNGVNIVDGATTEESCPDGMVGNATRTCTNGILSVADTSSCTYPAPSDLAYQQEQYVLTVNNAFIVSRPSVKGIVDTFSIEPELPAGITFVAKDGSFSGSPSEEKEWSGVFTVTASSEAGSATTTVALKIELPKCAATADFPATTIGESYTMDCKTVSGYKGTSTRTCEKSTTLGKGIWSAPTEFCVEKKLDMFMLIGIILIIVGVVLFVLGILQMVNRKKANLPKTVTAAPKTTPKTVTVTPVAAPAPVATAPAPAPVAAAPAPTPAPVVAAPAPTPAPAPAPAKVTL